ncbi:hypothetical protein [Streptomyces sp. NL15-2K]|uniref:hypothetical protein n=1 Tax=Streptomyces sp. NL15-2K TaxID=376149 RepID=UPI000F55FD2A|nr:MULTISPECIES: hypothetical protein [Actinomycetes]WKX10890.1 hypothetical protein Q4V64_26645 [Kutzneria buriramensis]GCB47550.1 hypothetical protein SNL152K_4855 [Streptomyces sp. NL15-2K]
MTRPPVRALLSSALSLGVLLTATACSSLIPRPQTAPRPAVPPTTPPSQATTHRSTTPPSPTADRALTRAQAEAALVTEADVGEPWTSSQGPATWRDGLLKATTKAPDCQRLLDALYAEELFGADARPRAVIGLDDPWNEAQMRYQIFAPRPADMDRTLAWMKTLPRKCDRFTAKTAHGHVQRVQVSEAPLPDAGDARQGLRVSLRGETDYGDTTLLRLEVAAVRVGDDAISVSNGGLGEVSSDVTRGAVELGARRLKEVRRHGRVEV